jgi:hypothetical protein
MVAGTEVLVGIPTKAVGSIPKEAEVDTVLVGIPTKAVGSIPKESEVDTDTVWVGTGQKTAVADGVGNGHGAAERG